LHPRRSSQFALRWTLSNPIVGTALVGFRTAALMSGSRPRWERDRYRDLGRLKQRVLWRITSAVFAL
jgi:hypothetical protein